MKVLVVTLVLVLGLFREAQAADNEVCFNNRLHTNAAAVASNLSIAFSVHKGRDKVFPEDGDRYHLKWGKERCLAADLGNTVKIYEKKSFGSWKEVRQLDYSHLKGVEVEFGQAKRIDKLYGINLRFDAKGDVPPSESWMYRLFGSSNIPLHSICMPGTHNSGSYTINGLSATDPYQDQEVLDLLSKFKNTGLTIPVKQVMTLWSKNQRHDIYEQLKRGARYLDIRARSIDGKLVAAHGLVGDSMQNIVDGLRRFVEENPGEVVIFHVQETHGMSSAERKVMYNLLRDELGYRIAPPSMGMSVTIPQMQNAGRQVIVVANDSQDDSMIWSRYRSLTNPWYDKNRPDELLNSLRDGIVNRNKNIFYVSQMVLTPTDKDIKNMAIPGYPSATEMLAKTLRYPSGFTRYLENAAVKRGRHVNIVLQDFIGASDVYRACMLINQQHLEQN
ncbi:phosphatidylinositol-specific phospholipase C domain-containing protein [Parendozoicomonas haliclonae]|uniref:1-phosphatidylinositol phosphodiesterase n=1 Tax=Parendozoicomonas haliclonae TaxID=1960125 RepID=A0A1X7AGP7_9GAMM|nr:phosphatidylinositol-specific phospholipase C domain-containing protein [Parendozoicomonas haliclonae]SMA40210.1 1-phosphatidylinositol phosphodiesterase precursor [Parendozoicomonas haliclonae]